MAYVSVIVPAHCRTEQEVGWFDECLESICNAGSHVGEIIVWDDASPCDVSSVVTGYNGIVFGRGLSNKGVSYARNRAVELSSGSLIFPVDCDDVLASDAISKLVSRWDGVPLYPDVYKFGDENVPHYQLLDFACEHITSKVGIASVGVLHSREQWESIGGWDEGLDFYEDGEYNARLFLTYCARHIREPLYGYRIHGSQRTKLNKARSAQMTRKVLTMIQKYERSIEMSCAGCGRRRTQSNNPSPVSVHSVRTTSRKEARPLADRIASLPGAEAGKVHALYIGGKGIGTHYYRGPSTRFPYKVKEGQLVQNVDPADTSDPNDPMHAQISLLVRVEPKRVEPTPAPAPVPQPRPEPAQEEPPVVKRVAKKEVAKAKVEEVRELPDISKLSYGKLVLMDLSPEDAAQLLEDEKEGRARKGHMAFLRRIAKE